MNVIGAQRSTGDLAVRYPDDDVQFALLSTSSSGMRVAVSEYSLLNYAGASIYGIFVVSAQY